MENLVSSVTRLQYSLSDDPEKTAETFIESYLHWRQDFIDRVRTDKIFFHHIRSIELGNNVFAAIHKAVITAATNGKIHEDEAHSLSHFLNEHRVIITPKIHISNYLNELRCWQIPREVALLEVAAEIEAQLRYHVSALNKNLIESQLSATTNGMLFQGGAKTILENGTILFREVLRRNPKSSSVNTANYPWNEVLTLADRWVALQLIEDRYTYFHQEVFIDSNEHFNLVVCRPRSFALEGALFFGEYRTTHMDLVSSQLALSDLAIDADEVGSRVLSHISTASGIDDGALLAKMPNEVETYVKALIAGSRQAVEESHLSILRSTGHYESEVLPILHAWECLYRLVILRKLALEQLLETEQACIGMLILVLPKESIIRYFEEFGEMDTQQAESSLQLLMFTTGRDRVDSYDPYLKPLVAFSGNRVLVLGSYIQNSRFARNALKLMLEQNIVNLDICGPSLEQHFREILNSAKFKTNKGCRVNILNEQGSIVTDIDVIGFRDGVLFLGQAKNVIPPGSAYEIYRMRERLEEAATQLRGCIENLQLNKGTIQKALGISEEDEFVVTTILSYILTNDITLTGYKIDEFIILDPIILEETLTELTHEGKPVEAMKLETEAFSVRNENSMHDITYHELDFGATVFLVPARIPFRREDS